MLRLDVPPSSIAGTTLGILIVMGIGEGIRNRRERILEYRSRAEQRKQSEVQAERMRIARELHDVLAHSLSQINVQAGVGLHLMDKQPQQAAAALASIKEVSKTALDEVRSVLGILRSEDGADPSAPLVPEPDLSRLPGLAASVTAQGVAVELQNSLTAPPPAAVQLAIYRIVQESLTNVVRHAQATRATVSVSAADGSYRVQVADNGTGAGNRGLGRGLTGMRERAELLGGTLTTGDESRRRLPGHRDDTCQGEQPMIRVAIADDQQLVRAGFAALVDSEPDLEVVGEASTGAEAVALVTRTKPDVVLMDIRMPDGDGLWATEQIVSRPELAGTHIVIVTTFELDEYVAHAIRAGASGFLVKDTEPVELIRAVRVVAAGDALLSPERHQAAARAGRRHARARPRMPAHSPCSPSANARCSASSAAVSPTRRSAAPCS